MVHTAAAETRALLKWMLQQNGKNGTEPSASVYLWDGYWYVKSTSLSPTAHGKQGTQMQQARCERAVHARQAHGV